MEKENYKIALLIDSENISAEYMSVLNKELIMFGRVSHKRMYGDFTKPNMSKWKSVINEFAILPVQQFSYTKGKNVTDSRIIIDAMDILHENKIDAFCIASSDSDFTTLAKRLKESNIFVIGAGEQKTPQSFVIACDRFLNLELLAEKYGKKEIVAKKAEVLGEGASATKPADDDAETDIAEGSVSITPKEEIEDFAVRLLEEFDGSKTSLEYVMNKIHQAYPNFSFLQYGVNKAYEFFSVDKFWIKKEENYPNMFIGLKEPSEEEIIETAIKILKSEKEKKNTKSMNIGTLCSKIYRDPQIAQNYPSFRFQPGEAKMILSKPAAAKVLLIEGEMEKTTVTLK